MKYNVKRNETENTRTAKNNTNETCNHKENNVITIPLNNITVMNITVKENVILRLPLNFNLVNPSTDNSYYVFSFFSILFASVE